jgi:hypothetical protein
LASRPTFTTQLYASGSTFFTVGFGDVSPMTPVAKLIGVAEAGIGFGFIAVVIGYLPVLYQLYARREIHVMQLDARAGSPPCALTLLCRHAERDARNELANLLRSWEAWCSELLVSHLSYPMLSYYRSQRDNQSWLAGLAAIMDSCALIMVGIKDMRPFEARMTFAMARLTALEMSRVFETKPATRLHRLSRMDFEALADRLSVVDQTQSASLYGLPPMRHHKWRLRGEGRGRKLVGVALGCMKPCLPMSCVGLQDNRIAGERGREQAGRIMGISYRRHRFPPVVVQNAVWLYLRFTLSYRDIEDLLAEGVLCETLAPRRRSRFDLPRARPLFFRRAHRHSSD